jgi:acetyltransferase
MAGHVMAVCDPDNQLAEFAVLVAQRWQDRGLGRLLMDKLVRHLRDRGTRELRGECLAENAGMAALAREIGFEVTPAVDNRLAMRLPLQPAAPG